MSQSHWIETPHRWVEAGLGLLYPEVCQLCGQGRAGPAAGYVCEACQKRVVFIKPPFCSVCGLPLEGAITHEFQCGNCRELDLQFAWARSSALASGPVLEAIHRYKYNRQMWFEAFLAGLLAHEALPVLQAGRWDLIVPVPLHPVKQREREFNQAERLGRRLGKAAGIPVDARLLRRIKATRTQTRLSRAERVENIRGAFTIRRPAALAGRHCLVVDDVLTTGSTTSECARVLRAAGAELVAVWTVARGGVIKGG
jgi:competence protein ComFC